VAEGERLKSATARLLALQVGQTFRSLRHRNFRIYFAGQFLSLCGTWMQNLAVGWLVYRLTHSPWMLGLVSFASLSPTLLFGLAGGHLADRVDRKRIILTAQSIGMVQAATLAALTLSNHVQVWQVLVLIALMGSANAFDIPARQSLIANLVPREDLVNAVSLNASMFNGARMIGPAIAGLLISYFSEGVCFIFNSVSYLAVITAILLIKMERREGSHAGAKSIAATDGLRFVANTPHIRNILLLVATLSLFGMQVLMLLPVIASEVLHGQAALFGALSASSGLGSMTAALLLANKGTGENLKRDVGFALLGFSAALFAFSHSTSVYLSAPLMMLVAFFMTYQLSGSQSLVQLAAPDHLRGKVVSVYMMIFMGMGPLGSLLAGWLARQVGAPNALSILAGVCACAAVIYLTGSAFSSTAKRS
jgi:MFS family permease